MRIVLPSQGVLGCREVDMDLPRYSHIRNLTQVNYNEEEIGYEFVKSLLTKPELLANITNQDKEYLLAIAVSSLHLNNIRMNVTCSCSSKVPVTYNLSELDVTDLEVGTSKCVTKELNGETYNFHFISAEDEQEIVRWAKKSAEVAIDYQSQYQRSYEEGLVCKTFGFELNDENIQKVSEYNIIVFYTALLFHEMAFHGVRTSVRCTCPKCGKQILALVPLAKSLMSWSSNDIINDFMSVSKHIGFDSFLNLTFGELAQMQANQDAGL